MESGITLIRVHLCFRLEFPSTEHCIASAIGEPAPDRPREQHLPSDGIGGSAASGIWLYPLLRALALDTAVLAVASYSIANADQRLGRRLTAREVHELLKNTGEAGYVELDYGRQEQKEP